MLLFSLCHIAYNVATSCHITHFLAEQNQSYMLILAFDLVSDLPQVLV